MESLPFVETWVVKRTGLRHYLCRLCGGVDDDHGTEAEFQRHLSSWPHRSKIMQREALRCTLCDLQFRYPSAIALHRQSKAHRMKEDPSLKPADTCEVCAIHFGSHKDYVRHLGSKKHATRSDPSCPKPGYCTVCQHDYHFPSQLQIHFKSKKHAKALSKTNSCAPDPDQSIPLSPSPCPAT